MKFLPPIFALLALSLLGNGCAQTLTHSDANAAHELLLANGAPGIAPVPAEDFFDSIFEKNGRGPAANENPDALVLPHRIRAEFAGETHEADAILKITHERLTLVVSAPAGRIFTLVRERDGAISLERGPFAPPGSDIDPAYLLSDLALVFAGVPALQKHFAAPWRIEEISAETAGTRVRRLFYKERLLCEIEFSGTGDAAGTPPMRERVKMQNFERKYCFEIIPTPNA